MTMQDPEAVWTDYYRRKKSQRLAEASAMWGLMSRAGIDDTTILALDFTHFGDSKIKVEALAEQLSENYEMQVVAGEENGYWFAKGTTRPYGVELNEEQHHDWVEFMADVAQSYACVFSTWSIEAPSIGTSWHSQEIDSAS